MSRWIVRGLGILIIIAFALLMIHLQRRLVEMQNSQRTPSTSTSR